MEPAGKKTVVGRYAGAAACTGAALLLRWALDPAASDHYPYVSIYIAVLIAARFFGVGPALLSVVTGGIGASYFFSPERYRLLDCVFSLGMAFFLVVALAGLWLMESLRRARADADERLAQLRAQSAERERQLQLSAQLRAIVESSEDAIISKDLKGIIQSWNKGAEQIFGYTAAEAVGKNISMLLPADRRHEESDIIERIRRGGRVKHRDTVRARKGGEQVHVSLTVSPIYDADGAVTGASHIARDITEQKELELQLRQAQKMESLGVLAGGLAHDFNNLLTGIMGNASLTFDDLPHNSTVRQRIGEVLQASERAALLVRQMLAYAGKGRFVVEPVDVSEQVSEIVPLVRTSFPPNVAVDLALEENLPRVDADRSQIQQLIMNLAINAAEAVGDQQGSVNIRTFSRENDYERQVVLEVRDTGCGMDEATKTRIFDPFYTTKFTGRGLGLSAVMGIVRAHRGTISVESAPGQGSTFTAVLPASRSAIGSNAPEEQVELCGCGNILVVDDEELVRNMARFTLERCGYTVDVAVDGGAAVELFRRRPDDFAAVLLDLTMPVLSGEEALHRIREIRPNVPVILSSGFSETEALRRFEKSGLAGFLQKPYTATALARKVKKAVRLSGEIRTQAN